MKKGETYTSRKLTLTQDFINKFADFSGDYNPIHINEDFAKKVGLTGTIAHGVIMLQYLTELLESKFKNGFSFDVKFIKPARPGETIFAKITVMNSILGEVVFEASVVDTKGEIHIVGQGEGRL